MAIYALKSSGAEGQSSGPAAAPLVATTPTATTPAAATPTAKMATVVVTYFTTNVRCTSCRTIESLARTSVEDYQLTNRTVIVSHQVDGHESEWLNRQDVWLLLHDPNELMSYVREPVAQYLRKS